MCELRRVKDEFLAQSRPVITENLFHVLVLCYPRLTGSNWPGAHLKDSDLWLDRFIEMASFVKLGAQMEDIDYSSPLERCWFCEQGPFEGQESLSTHIEETHPGKWLSFVMRNLTLIQCL